jgi:hypothetical protein
MKTFAIILSQETHEHTIIKWQAQAFFINLVFEMLVESEKYEAKRRGSRCSCTEGGRVIHCN